MTGRCARRLRSARRSAWSGSGVAPMSRWSSRSMRPMLSACARRRPGARHRRVSGRLQGGQFGEALEMVEAPIRRTAGRGRFISFEGGEGSGKSTQIKKLAERLEAAKLRAIITREPGGSPGAEVIRHLLLSGMGKLLGAEAETLLFAAARDDHVHTVIQPALAQGTWG